MVHADFIMQSQGMVSIAPDIADPIGLFYDEGSDIELSESRGEHEASLAATDDQYVRVLVLEQTGCVSTIQPIFSLIARNPQIFSMPVSSGYLWKCL
jgi:hypothetical protein